jgi:hypothetical protein
VSAAGEIMMTMGDKRAVYHHYRMDVTYVVMGPHGHAVEIDVAGGLYGEVPESVAKTVAAEFPDVFDPPGGGSAPSLAFAPEPHPEQDTLDAWVEEDPERNAKLLKDARTAYLSHFTDATITPPLPGGTVPHPKASTLIKIAKILAEGGDVAQKVKDQIAEELKI